MWSICTTPQQIHNVTVDAKSQLLPSCGHAALDVVPYNMLGADHAVVSPVQAMVGALMLRNLKEA